MPSSSKSFTGRTCSTPLFTPTTAFSPAGTLPRKTPPTRDQIFALADEAVHEADWRLSKNPNDVDALFARAWVRSLRCTYVAMVERGFGAGFRLANKAKDDARRVLQLDPDYVDAKLITGVYEYVVGALPWPFKLMIGFAGISGLQIHRPRDAARRGQSRRNHQH